MSRVSRRIAYSGCVSLSAIHMSLSLFLFYLYIVLYSDLPNFIVTIKSYQVTWKLSLFWQGFPKPYALR